MPAKDTAPKRETPKRDIEPIRASMDDLARAMFRVPPEKVDAEERRR